MDIITKCVRKELQRLRRRFRSLPDVVIKFEEAMSHLDSKQFVAAAACLESIDDLDVSLREEDRIAVIACISELQLLDDEVRRQADEFATSCGQSTTEDIVAVVEAESERTMKRGARLICMLVGSGFAVGAISLFRSLLAGGPTETSWYLLAALLLVTGLGVAAVGMFGSSKTVIRILDSI